MEKRRLGRTGHMSTVAIFGAAAFSEISQQDADSVMEIVIEAGVNHIDVAPSYGQAEERIGPCMPHERERFFLGCKTMERTKANAWEEMQSSLKRLRTDHFDLYQLHAVTNDEELDACTMTGGALEALVEACQRGLIRHIGITGHGVDAPQLFIEALKRFDFDSVMFPLNFVQMANPTFRKDVEELIALCKKKDVGAMVIKTITKGPWGKKEKTATTWYEPFDKRNEIQRAVNFALSCKVTGSSTVGDTRILPIGAASLRKVYPAGRSRAGGNDTIRATLRASFHQGVTMPDPRVTKLAKLMVHYSLKIKPGQQVLLQTSPLADELSLAFIEEVVKAGAHVLTINAIPGASEVFFKYASEKQLDFLMPLRKTIYETFDARMVIEAESNTRELAGIDPKRVAHFQKTYAPLFKIFSERLAKGEFKWCMTVYPTEAMAQEANMSLSDYREFVYGAGMLNEDDPVAFWTGEAKRQQELVDWLQGRKQAVFKGENIDLSMSIDGRNFIPCAGTENFPDGEIFTSPVEDSVNGWVRFKYPAIFSGQEIEDIELWFENGKVVKEKAGKNQNLLTAQLDTDAGARYLGEWGIGTNYGITRFTKNMLFDEKIGGTIHLAVGLGFPEAGGKNESGTHWDMLCDMKQAEITIDNNLFYKNGKPVIT